jgi:hypothetical protein
MNIAVLIPVVSTVHVAPPSTFEMIDTKWEVEAENENHLPADELTKTGQLLDPALMTTILLTATSVRTRFTGVIEAKLMILAIEVGGVAEPVITHMIATLRIRIQGTSLGSVRGLLMADHTRIREALIEVAKEVREQAHLVRSFSLQCWTQSE